MRLKVLVLILVPLLVLAAFGTSVYSFNAVKNSSGSGGCRLDENATAEVSGVVLDGDSGEPVEGALIVHASGVITPFTTGANGSYRFEGLREGTHHFDVTAGGYKDRTVQVILTKNSTVTFDIELEDDKEEEEYNIALWVAVGVFVSLVGLLITIYYVSGKKKDEDEKNKD